MLENKRRDWRPSELAEMLWIIGAAIILGWIVVLALGHPFDIMP